MAVTQYDYTKEAEPAQLKLEIENSAIVTALDRVDLVGNDGLQVFFKEALSSGDETILDGLVTAHVPSVAPGVSLVEINGPKDVDGSPMTRVKMFKSGVAVRFHFFGITTAKYSGAIHHKKSDNSTDFGYLTSKIYDASDVEITSSANEGSAVKTVLDFEPPNLDYEIIAGKFYQSAPPATDIYVHVVAVPDIPEASGGSINFCSNANLKRMPSGIAFETDGRVPKKMVYNASLHLSKMRIIFFHDAGVQHECMGELEIAH